MALVTLENVEGDLSSARYVTVGLGIKLGTMDAAVVAIPAATIDDLGARNVLHREDFQLGISRPANRYVTKAHVNEIMRGISDHADKLLIGTLILSIAPEHVEFRTVRPITATPPFSLVEIRVKQVPGAMAHIMDGQNRIEALRKLTRELDKKIEADPTDMESVRKRDLLRNTSVPVIVVREGDPDEVHRMFVTLARTKPIPASLIAAMDMSSVAHKIAIDTAKRVDMLKGPAPTSEPAAALEVTKSGVKGPDKLYPAAAWRTACAIILGGFRDRTPEQREQSVKLAVKARFGGKRAAAVDRLTEIWNYAYKTMPGWKEIRGKTLARDKFRLDWIHGNAAGLYTFAGAIAAAEATGTSFKTVIDALATLKWERDAKLKRRNSDRPEHPLFPELVRYLPVIDQKGAIVEWVMRPTGGARSAYEQSTQTLLAALAKANPELDKLAERETLVKIGLVRDQGPDAPKRGRPKK
jgi:hypothetical protein